MPTNAEIHAAIDLYITSQRSHILNDSVAQIFHDMVDNIPSGEAETPTLDDVLQEGATLTDDSTIDVDGNNLRVNNREDEVIFLDVLNTNITVGYKKGLNFGIHGSAADAFGGDFRSRADFNDGVKYAEILGHASAGACFLQYIADKHKFSSGINEFADNAAAVTGGLEVGTIYRTGDLMKIVH